ncbi:MAG: hypothetical protein JNL01_10365 [Bdellovibrionales bacterium]|nr:hypothetical protein [Bdellovibrionales bacterium]
MKILVLSFLISVTALAEEAPQKVEKSFPEWHAVKKFSSEDGFQLKDEAIQSMGIKFSPIQGNSPWKIPESALVRVKYSTGVYRKYQEWISFVLVDVVSKNGGQAVVKSQDLESGDQIAVIGGSELRLTESDLTSDTVDTCSH